jgi:hypothetical protein
MDTEDNRQEQETTEVETLPITKPKRQYTEEQLEKRKQQLKCALERKKELAIIRKADLQKKEG